MSRLKKIINESKNAHKEEVIANKKYLIAVSEKEKGIYVI